MKAMNSPRASATPQLRAPAGPVFGWRMTLRSNFAAQRFGSRASGGSLPSSTTITSKLPAGRVCAAKASRHDSTARGRLRVGMMTLMLIGNFKKGGLFWWEEAVSLEFQIAQAGIGGAMAYKISEHLPQGIHRE